jgi:hypothetical protein
MKRRVSGFGAVILTIAACSALVGTCVAMDAGCRAGGEGVEALKAQGMTDIVLGDRAWWGCGRDDSFNSEFVATNAQGKRVSGAVCCGWLKGCTVRF